jgi:transcriptional regulator with XRE-family HTH domain
MFEIGASLAAARRARGLGLRDAERLTCMRAKYLTALEEDRFDELPGRTYTRAFLRTYAAALGLRADEFVAEFDAQNPEPEEAEIVVVRPRRRVHLPFTIPALAAIAVVAILGWSAWTGDNSLNPTVTPPAPAVAAAAAVKPRVRPQVVVAAPRPARTVVVRAVRGPCWVEARRGTATGALLAQRTLARGESATFAAPRVWLRLGAPWNVVVQRGMHTLRLPSVARPVNVAY